MDERRYPDFEKSIMDDRNEDVMVQLLLLPFSSLFPFLPLPPPSIHLQPHPTPSACPLPPSVPTPRHTHATMLHCRQDNNLPHDSSLEPSFRAKMHYQNCLKSSLYSIKQSLEIILRGTKHRVSEVPQTLLQLFHKILLICTIPMV